MKRENKEIILAMMKANVMALGKQIEKYTQRHAAQVAAIKDLESVKCKGTK
jgi:hypothetical protein